MPEQDANAAFDRLAERILKSHVELNPTEGTWLGIHGSNDGELPDRAPEAAERELGTLQDHLHSLGHFRERELSIDRAVDLRLARGGIASQILRLQKHPAWRESPILYVDDVVFGLYSLLVRDFAPPEKRAKPLIDRLKQVPRHLERARENLHNPPAIFTESAAMSAAGSIDFFDRSIQDFAASLGDPRLRSGIESAGLEARAAMLAFHEWLEGSLMPYSHGDFAVGRATFERLLVEEHALPWNADELIAVGQHVYQEAMREMKRVSARIESGKPWSKVVESVKLVHPTEAEVLNAYASEMARAREFVRSTGLATLPESACCDVVPTPAFARPIFPYAAYLGPAPFEEKQCGTFWVTTVDPGLPEERREVLLRGHARFGIPVTALHKACPGHHLQQIRANQVKGHPLRFIYTSSTFSEGWALYCEDLMYRHGYFTDERVRLLQLKDLLWRACRVIIDVGLQTGQMGFTEAETFLVRKARIERPNARAEVRRYCANPTQPMSYVAGKILIDELVEDTKATLGDRFDLLTFHDEILGHGTIPIELVRMEMRIPRREAPGRGPGRRPSMVSRLPRTTVPSPDGVR
jgi:uncharacterized protein (DUF885 family)